MIRDELSEQLRLKIIKHLYGTKRQSSDFVKGKYNEVDTFARRAADNDHALNRMEREADGMHQDEPDFDREAFDQLKREIGQRKKLKEDMLSGTIPRFAPYLRL